MGLDTVKASGTNTQFLMGQKLGNVTLLPINTP